MTSIIPTSIPFGQTVEFADANAVEINLSNLGMSRASAFTLTNVSKTDTVYVSTKASATPEDEEYTLMPLMAINFNYNSDPAFSLYVRGTAGEKFTFLIS